MKLTLQKILGIAAILLVPSLASAASFSVSPASQTLKVGDTLTVSIKLDTQGASIDGVDIHYLTFNPSLLQVIDGNKSTAGTQINAENLMALTVLNSVDNAKGQVAFSQVAAGGTKYKGSGVLATVQFKAIAPGNASLTFNYTPKSTTDSNIAAGGKDILSLVVNGSYTITGTPMKAPTPPPVVKSPQGVVTEPGQADVPPTDTSDFQYSQKKGFWATLFEAIRNYLKGFKTRLSEGANVFK